MRSFKAGQQQDEPDAGKCSEAPEETRSALVVRNHTQACSPETREYNIAPQIPATTGTKGNKITSGQSAKERPLVPESTAMQYFRLGLV
jgi:hypothetical protein